jgi:hypothetical protein
MRRSFPLLAGVLLLSAGCGKIDYEQTVAIPKDEQLVQVEFKAPSADKKVKVAARSEGGPVSVYLTLFDDLGEVTEAVRQKAKPRKAIATAEKTSEATIEGTIPAGKPFVVLVHREEPGDEIKVKLDVKGE